eukprot:CAMPEP_0170328188 /NCGR_PEP_ID=MMETSP0116_2-20130129/64994_1 /TAXON_ID=400756 /ORGANISM="Durinskia baltica, Strain CSIRO CS-38" /LENGTH=120 /DNA_ID=CAMNT_0010581291 /DNA_START=1087 /DNA_END=1450 /DNA_ORIENTATION=-
MPHKGNNVDVSARGVDAKPLNSLSAFLASGTSSLCLQGALLPHIHKPDNRSHSPSLGHGGQSGGRSEQAIPLQPPSHMHVPEVQSPCPLQATSGHTISTSHCSPIQPGSQMHMSGRLQDP